MEAFLNDLCGGTLTEEQIRMMNPVKLAYIGDVVFELYVRMYVIHVEKRQVHLLNKKTVSFVNAGSQAKVARALETFLTEEEWTVLKRGRNQKSLSPPKNANIGDYKYATGFESLLGYLYLMGQTERVREIVLYAVKLLEGATNEVK
ncbi:MAG: Mini-ribonuclease 3 [Clostridia bacterium]|nr:Mini-ribonuclease 3 [Clostridia bacterium]